MPTILPSRENNQHKHIMLKNTTTQLMSGNSQYTKGFTLGYVIEESKNEKGRTVQLIYSSQGGLIVSLKKYCLYYDSYTYVFKIQSQFVLQFVDPLKKL